MKEYIFKYLPENPKIFSPIWEGVSKARIDCVSFSPKAINPMTTVKGVYSDKGLTVLFQSDEKNVLARYKGVNEKPWTDSCVEIFFNPCPTLSDKYFNFELSAGGGLLIGYGEERGNRLRCDFTLDIFDIETEIKSDGWTAKLTIPFSFVLKYAEEFHNVFSGNFQKCGDETQSPHFVVWNEIKSNIPDFHKPEFFGKFILGRKKN